jgi:F-type H+-transporting ATPase subunit b
MLIDWFTVAAQAVNFLILVWLLKRFLYRPILNAIDAREKRVAAALAAAEAQKAEAQKEREAFQKKNESFDQQRAAMLRKAEGEAKTERQRLFDEAGRAADALAAKRQEAWIKDAKALDQAIGKRAREEVFAITRKALADLASADLEERMVHVMLQHLDELRVEGVKAEKKAASRSATRATPAPVLVRTAFELPPTQTDKIEHAIRKAFGSTVQVRFETAPQLVSGIELTTNGHKLAWNIDDYLGSLQRSIDELLQEKDKSGAGNKLNTRGKNAIR